MGITPIATGTATPTTSVAANSAAGSSSPASKTKNDTLIVSQKAKDLAAQLAGKSNQEEMSESMAAKMQEGDNS